MQYATSSVNVDATPIDPKSDTDTSTHAEKLVLDDPGEQLLQKYAQASPNVVDKVRRWLNLQWDVLKTRGTEDFSADWIALRFLDLTSMDLLEELELRHRDAPRAWSLDTLRKALYDRTEFMPR